MINDYELVVGNDVVHLNWTDFHEKGRRIKKKRNKVCCETSVER